MSECTTCGGSGVIHAGGDMSGYDVTNSPCPDCSATYIDITDGQELEIAPNYHHFNYAVTCTGEPESALYTNSSSEAFVQWDKWREMYSGCGTTIWRAEKGEWVHQADAGGFGPKPKLLPPPYLPPPSGMNTATAHELSAKIRHTAMGLDLGTVPNQLHKGEVSEDVVEGVRTGLQKILDELEAYIP